MGTRRECKNLIQGEGYKTPCTSRLHSCKVYMTYAPKPNRRPGVVKTYPDKELESQMDSPMWSHVLPGIVPDRNLAEPKPLSEMKLSL